MNIIFVKWGTKYPSEDVNTLYNSLKKYCDYDFYCYTDDPTGIDSDINKIDIPSKPALKVWWNKLPMFNKDFPLHGKTIFFDLDVYIRHNPFPLIETSDWSKLTLIDCRPWKDIINTDGNYSTRYDVTMNSTVITWDADNPEIHKMWDHFNGSQKDYFLRKYKGIDRFIQHEGFSYELFSTELIQSYKYQLEDDYMNNPIVTFEEVDYGRSDIKTWIEDDKENLRRKHAVSGS